MVSSSLPYMMASLNDRKQTHILLSFSVSFTTSDFIPNVNQKFYCLHVIPNICCCYCQLGNFQCRLVSDLLVNSQLEKHHLKMACVIIHLYLGLQHYSVSIYHFAVDIHPSCTIRTPLDICIFYLLLKKATAVAETSNTIFQPVSTFFYISFCFLTCLGTHQTFLLTLILLLSVEYYILT